MNEIGSIRVKYNLGRILQKPAKRRYPFDREDVPKGLYLLFTFFLFNFTMLTLICIGEIMCLKVICSHEKTLPADISGKTFSHIFGTQTSARESLIIKRKLMGPSWLKITNAKEDAIKVIPSLIT